MDNLSVAIAELLCIPQAATFQNSEIDTDKKYSVTHHTPDFPKFFHSCYAFVLEEWSYTIIKKLPIFCHKYITFF